MVLNLLLLLRLLGFSLVLRAASFIILFFSVDLVCFILLFGAEINDTMLKSYCSFSTILDGGAHYNWIFIGSLFLRIHSASVHFDVKAFSVK